MTPLHEHSGTQQLQGLSVKLPGVHAVPSRLIDCAQGVGGVAGEQVGNQLQLTFAVAQSQQFLHLADADAVGVGHRELFQKVFRIPKAAPGVAGHQAQGVRVYGHSFRPGDFFQTGVNQIGGNAAEVKPLATGDNRRENLVGLGGAKDENDMAGRLFQGFQEGVGGRVGEHVGFVDDVDLAAALDGGKVDLFPYIPNLVDSAVAGGVKFDDVHEPPFVNRLANDAGVTGVAVLKIEAVDHLGQDTGGGSFAAAAGAAEQVRMRDTPLLGRLAQSSRDVLLAYQLAEAGGAPFLVVHLGRHWPWASRTPPDGMK